MSLKTVKTLLIEDNRDHTELITSLLEESSLLMASVVTAQTLDEARQLILSNKYDLILSDLSLPDSVYKDTLKELKKIVQDTPIVVLTALDDKHTISTMIKEGANDCIPKSQLSTAVLERAIIYCIDRFKAEEEVKLSEQKFRNYFEKSYIGLAITDLKGNIIDINPSFSKFIGFNREEFIGKNLREVTFSEDLKNSNEWIEKLLNNECAFFSLEKRYITKKGNIVWGNVNVQKIQWESNKECLFAEIVDITDRKKYEEEHRLAETRLEKLTSAFSSLGHNSDKNINMLTRICGELLGGSCALYNRLEGDMLCSTGQWNTPPDFNPVDKPEGHICYDVITKEKDVYVVKNLSQTTYSKSDPNVALYGLKSYIGKRVYCFDKNIGALCVVYQNEINIDKNDKKVLGILATAIGIEEERREVEKKSKRAIEEMKMSQEASLNIMEDLDRHRKELDSSLKEKEVLLREIHHRVKNNMQVITSLLKIQGNYIKDEKYKEMLRESESRIRSMALIHEKLYRTKDLANIDFRNYTTVLAKENFRSFGTSPGRVKLKVEIEDVQLGIDSAIPCGLIINELISNSLKHGFPEGKKGELKVTMSKESEHDKIELMISDSGVGFPKELDFKDTSTLGMHLVNTLVRQLGGEIELSREHGTEWLIKFELKDSWP